VLSHGDGVAEILTHGVDVLALLGKPQRTEWWIEPISRMKSAGISVGIILLLGAGGRELAPRHVAETLAFVERLALDPADIVFLSPVQNRPDARYWSRLEEDGLSPLSDAEMKLQGRTLKAAIRRDATCPRVARYDIRDFVD